MFESIDGRNQHAYIEYTNSECGETILHHITHSRFFFFHILPFITKLKEC